MGELTAVLGSPNCVLKDCVRLCLQKEMGKQADCPYMCAYKLVTVKFKWWGLQNKVENFIHKVSQGINACDIRISLIGLVPPACC